MPIFFLLAMIVLQSTLVSATDQLTDVDQKLVRDLEQNRIAAIDQVIGSVVAIYDNDRQGGGSGVIIDPTGIALTNHHVIVGAGVSGWGGLADGKLYRWKLIGTDPGGDLSIIQMESEDPFPFTPLGDSDRVRVGDWALAMGNPFILTEDQSPTVTLGIVSGVKRYQPGAGQNKLVYGNCIQVDSSINPGNSGGPLFNFHGRVIGINGRGSFQDRGRVNVGLGYAISSNQIKNFIPDLLASKLVEHATLDASFSDRGGKVICTKINLDSPAAEGGLDLADELLEFEGEAIKNANQFTNLICTLPEDWPATLKFRKPDGLIKTIHVRSYGLPYRKPNKPRGGRPDDKDQTPEQKKQTKRQFEMIELLSADPGTIRFPKTNHSYAKLIVGDWQARDGNRPADGGLTIRFADSIKRGDQTVGQQTLWLTTDGKFRLQWKLGDQVETFIFDGTDFFAGQEDNLTPLSIANARSSLPLIQAVSLLATLQTDPFHQFGNLLLDGSDKALQQNAWRMKRLDSTETPFYFWLKMYDQDGLPAPRLVKASGNKDCQEAGGVTFTNWRALDGAMFPLRRDFVKGLAEEPDLSLVYQSHEWLKEVDEALFSGPETEKKTGDDEEAESDDSLEPDTQSDSLSSDDAPANSARSPVASGRLQSTEGGWSQTKCRPQLGASRRSTPATLLDRLRPLKGPPAQLDENFYLCIQTQEGQPPAIENTDVDAPQVSASIQPTPASQTTEGFFERAVTLCQPKMAKVFGAGAGRVESFATGILVSAEGHVLTTQGVFLDGRAIRVVLADGSEHQATVLKRDRVTQLALLKIQAQTPNFFKLSTEPVGEQGDWVIAITNAFKVADKDEPLSATLGVISLRTSIEARINKRDVAYKGDLVLIDAITSNPGAGGGAAVTADGKLIGMVGKIINSSETNTRLNYAVPSYVLAQFVSDDDPVATDTTTQPATTKEKVNLGIVIFKMGGRNNPAYVDRVKRGSPAASANFQTDDMIVSIAGQKIGNLKEYDDVIDTLQPNEEIVIIVKRGTSFLRIPITPEVQK